MMKKELFFINNPKCVLRCTISEEWIHTKYLDDFLDFNLTLVPFEYEDSIFFENSSSLIESLLEVITPVFRESAILLSEP